MLVLSRQKDESIVIAGKIEVVVIDIRGNKVRLGIRASRDIPVHRKELLQIGRQKNERDKDVSGDFKSDLH